MDEFDAFRAHLDQLVATGRRLRLWLRDDDAVQPTEALDRLLSLMNRYRVPGLLAVIPAHATPALAVRLAEEPLALVAAHGWAHENRQPPRAKKSEFGTDRPVSASLLDMTRGREVIDAAFGTAALPVFVPPWNRIGPEAVGVLSEAGYSALSVFGAAEPGPLPQMNSHVDLIDWRGTRGGRPAGALLGEVTDWADTDETAVGVLTHHLVHDAAAWTFLDRFLAATSGHAAVEWVSPRTLLAETMNSA